MNRFAFLLLLVLSAVGASGEPAPVKPEALALKRGLQIPITFKDDVVDNLLHVVVVQGTETGYAVKEVSSHFTEPRGIFSTVFTFTDSRELACVIDYTWRRSHQAEVAAPTEVRWRRWTLPSGWERWPEKSTPTLGEEMQTSVDVLSDVSMQFSNTISQDRLGLWGAELAIAAQALQKEVARLQSEVNGVPR